MKKLPAGALRDRLSALMKRLSVTIDDLYEIGLSRKTKRSNAAVMGLGSSRRIVLGDTLIGSFTGEEIETVLAHEVAHYKKNHIMKFLLLQLAAVTGVLWLFERTHISWLGLFRAESLADLSLYPMILLMVIALGTLSLPLANGLSRSFEREADRFALEATGLPHVFISTMDKLARLNRDDRSPHPLIEWLLFSHPSIEKRIQYARGRRMG